MSLGTCMYCIPTNVTIVLSKDGTSWTCHIDVVSGTDNEGTVPADRYVNAVEYQYLIYPNINSYAIHTLILISLGAFNISQLILSS